MTLLRIQIYTTFSLWNFAVLVSHYSPAYIFYQVWFPHHNLSKPCNPVSLPNLWKANTGISSVQSLSRVQLFVTTWTAACQASMSITNSWSLLKLMSIESVMPSNHLILCHPCLFLPSIFPSIRVFSNEWVLHWPKYSLAKVLELQLRLSNKFDCLPLGLTGWISLKSKGLSRVFSNTTVQKHQFFSAQLSIWSNSHTHTWLLEKL